MVKLHVGQKPWDYGEVPPNLSYVESMFIQNLFLSYPYQKYLNYFP